MVWTLQTGQVEGHEAPPIVNNGVMFVATPGNQVLAIDAKDGNLLWRYKRPIPDDMLLLHPTSRGVGLFGDKVYFAAADAVLVALDAKTGKEAWKTKVEDYTHGYYMTLSPLVADGKVMVGCSGGELGVRGFVAAFDAETGKPLWKTYTVPAPGEPGSETWPKGDQWKTGGGPVWIMGNYDPATNIAYWGTGNGGPWMGDQRPGDNLYTSSVLALDVATGAIKGYHQYHPNDSWDWDEVSPPILVDYRHDGKTVKGLVDVARDGYLWELARTSSGPIEFVAGEPFVKQNVFKSLDPKTGRPNVDPVRQPGDRQKGRFLPVLVGRQGLAAGRLQSEDTAALYSGQRKPVRHLDRRKGEIFARRAFRRCDNDALYRAGRRSHRRIAGVERRYREEGLEPSFRQFPDSGGRYWRPAAGLSSWAAPTTAISAPSTLRPARCCGSSAPARGDRRAGVVSASAASNTSRSSRAGGSIRRACRRVSTLCASISFPMCRRAAQSGCSQLNRPVQACRA